MAFRFRGTSIRHDVDSTFGRAHPECSEGIPLRTASRSSRCGQARPEHARTGHPECRGLGQGLANPRRLPHTGARNGSLAPARRKGDSTGRRSSERAPKPGLPPLHEIEATSHPKERLKRALVEAAELSGRRLKKFRLEVAVSRIAELMNPLLLRQLPAFAAFERDLSANLARIESRS